MKDYILRIEDLHVGFRDRVSGKVAPVLNGISFGAERGKILGVVGESGSGKSVTMLSVLRLLGKNAEVSGKIFYNDTDLLALPEKEMRALRGGKLAMVFQDPMTTLNPVLTIGEQLREVVRIHRPEIRDIDAYLAELLAEVGIGDGLRRLRQYPHELSGGRRQRIVIAMALAGAPEILIADEPTTALDVTIQAQVLDLIRELTKKYNMTTIMITHDLGIVANLCDNVVVLYGGEICEMGTTREIFKETAHAYTRGLIAAVPGANASERLVPIEGTPVNRDTMPEGCPFCPRCKEAMEICLTQLPEETVCSPTHSAWCWLNALKEVPHDE